jgi:DNA primase
VPGVDFARIRTEITMEQVLNLLGFQPSKRTGVQWYGRCPLHESTSTSGRGRAFSVNVAIGRYYCHGCQSRGNQLDLWAAATRLPLHQAAIELCRRLGRDTPWIRRW